MSRKRITFRKNAEGDALPQFVQNGKTLEELFEIFSTAKKVEGISPRTIDDYATNLTYFLRWMEQSGILHLKPDELDKNHFRSYIAYMAEKYSPVTVNIRLTTLKTMFNFLAEEMLLPNNPLERIGKVKEPEGSIEAFTEEQVDALLKQPDQRTFFGFRDYVMMTLMLDTGIRINEVLSLEKKNVDLAQHQLSIVGFKSKNRRTRIIPFSKHTAKLLKELLAETAAHFDVDLVFVSSDGNPMSYFTAYSNIRKYGERAGIEGARVSPHTFRHTFAKMYVLNGGDAFSLQRILGHSSLHMVKKYIQLNTHDLHVKHAQHSPIVSLISRKARVKR